MDENLLLRGGLCIHQKADFTPIEESIAACRLEVNLLVDTGHDAPPYNWLAPTSFCRESMPNQPNPRRPKRGTYSPKAETLELLRVSGNPINGLGERTPRRPSPFFWHPPDQHPYGDLQNVARQSSRRCPDSGPAFMAAYNYPELLPVADVRSLASAQQLSAEVASFALAHEADAVGISAMDPLYVFEGYTVDEPWVIVLALAHNYERLKEVPSDETNGIGVVDIGDQ